MNTEQNTFSEPSHAQIKDLIYQIRRLMQAGSLYTKELDRNYKVSSPQLSCLIALYEAGPLPPSHIARYIMVKSSTVTGIIDRLEHKGLVRRTRNSPDRRVINIELTDKGRMLAENAPSPIQQKIVDGVKRLPRRKIDEIIKNIKLLTDMLDDQDFDLDQPTDESKIPL
ncbi:MAG: MarR family transcriptional regulator [Deltaproteobacteria bacterium]|nr:MarR family transcriptional regulator [Deltaproteobacteria bacterium]